MVVKTFHHVDWDAVGRRTSRAICGALVDRYRETAPEPNCPTCAQLLAERREDATVEDVFGSDHGGASVQIPDFNPTEGYRQKGRFTPPDQPSHTRGQMEKSWAYPALADGRLYIRDHNVLWCYDVKTR